MGTQKPWVPGSSHGGGAAVEDRVRRGWGGLQWWTGCGWVGGDCSGGLVEDCSGGPGEDYSGGPGAEELGGTAVEDRGRLQWRTRDGDCSGGPGVGLGGMAVEDQGEDCSGGLGTYCSGGGLSGGLQ